MKKSGLLILVVGAALFLAMPAMAQKKVTLQEIQKSEQKAQTAEMQTLNTDAGIPGKSVAKAPQPGNVPLTCTWDKTEHDFATSVMHQKPAKATFTLTNAGKTPVTISEVVTTCGCTSPNYTKEPIKSGEKGIVSLTYDAKITGFFTKSAIVKMNDGQKYILTIKGEVQKVDDGSTTGK
ncbi:MAG: hypothetical protein A2X22_00385 [Bacteroidetes bacterium GWF2_49_14]|nr:MAG: hypothetical protein A2X22_00385 [Bacteroidetes bacterium GWF2_49_14]HBB91084.1 hypothetical protein [Bacteroidales bacterium]